MTAKQVGSERLFYLFPVENNAVHDGCAFGIGWRHTAVLIYARIARGFADTGLDVALQVLQPVAHGAGADLDERHLGPGPAVATQIFLQEAIKSRACQPCFLSPRARADSPSKSRDLICRAVGNYALDKIMRCLPNFSPSGVRASASSFRNRLKS